MVKFNRYVTITVVYTCLTLILYLAVINVFQVLLTHLRQFMYKQTSSDIATNPLNGNGEENGMFCLIQCVRISKNR